MMYAFAKPEAVRSFREAWKRDPELRDLLLGRGVGVGLVPERADERRGGAARLRRDAEGDCAEGQRAPPRSARSSTRWPSATSRNSMPRSASSRTGPTPRRWASVADAYPDDLDIATLYADALFLLEPRRGTRDVKSPNVQRLHHVLERILAKDVHHPGACHLYVHATESTVVPERAAACAEFLGKSIPGASHINHMPSHTWNEVGRWGDSVRANLEAWHSDLKAAIGEGFAIYPEHNLHMLLYAASMDGQGAIAMQAGKDYAKLTGDTFYQVLTLVRFGRFDEVLEVTNRPKDDILGGFWDFAQGYAQLTTGQRRLRAGVSRARQEDGRHVEGRVPVPLGEESARHRRGHSRRGDSVGGGRSRRRDRGVRAGVDARGRAGLRRAGAAAVCGAPLARRGAARSEALRRCREASIARSSTIIRTTAGRCSVCSRRSPARADVRRGRRRPREELVARRHLDPLITFLKSPRRPAACRLPANG